MLKLACSTLSIEGFGETNFDKTFDWISQIGYKHIEFNCWYPSSLRPDTLKSLKERCDQAGLEAASIHLNAGIGAADNAALVKDFSHKVWAMQAIRILGGRRIVTSGDDRGQSGGVDGIIRSLEALVPVAEELDVLICLENHDANNLQTIEDYRRILDAVPSNHVGICVDTGHFDASAVDIDKLIDEFAPRINHLHLKENDGVGVKKFVRFGEGTTDNRHVVQRMLEAGFSGYMSVELSPESGASSGRPFTIEDVKVPYEMFKGYEN